MAQDNSTLMVITNETPITKALLKYLRPLTINVIVTTFSDWLTVTAGVDHIFIVIDSKDMNSFMYTSEVLQLIMKNSKIVGKVSVIFYKGEGLEEMVVRTDEVNALVDQYNIIPLFINAFSDKSLEHAATRLQTLTNQSAGRCGYLTSALIASFLRQHLTIEKSGNCSQNLSNQNDSTSCVS